MASAEIKDSGDVDQEGIEAAPAALLRTAIASGSVVSAHHRYALPSSELRSDSSGEAEYRPAEPRKIGIGYVFQYAMNALPLLAVDIVGLVATVGVCRIVFRYFGLPVGLDVSASMLPIVTGFVLINTELGLYPGVRLSPVEEFRRLVVSVAAVFTIWTIGVAVLTGELSTQKWFLLVVFGLCLVGLPIYRSWARRFLGRWTSWGIPVLICGDDATTVKLYDWIASNPRLGFRPIGVIADANALEIDKSESWYAGNWDEAQEIANRNGVYWAVVVPPEGSTTSLSQLVTDYLSGMPHIHVLSELTGLPDHWSTHRELDGLTGVHLQQNLLLPLPRIVKRVMDLVAAVIGGILLLPLLFYIAVAVKLSSRGPIFYGHDRIGQGGRSFKAWKFRTMFQNAGEVLELYLEAHPELQEEWNRDHKLKYDPRITRIGRFLRKTSLDELPQLWNVIRGEMSLVGPRPIVTAEIPKYGPYYGLYSMVMPGITGLWQVSGRNNTTYEERVQLDAYYVRNWSPWMDLYLLIRTIRIVLFAEGAY